MEEESTEQTKEETLENTDYYNYETSDSRNHEGQWRKSSSGSDRYLKVPHIVYGRGSGRSSYGSFGGLSRRHSFTKSPSFCTSPDVTCASHEEWTHREYSHQVKVEMKATFMKITDVDTLSQQFEAEVFLQAKWEELFYLGMSPQQLMDLLPGDLWDPEFIISNLAGDFDSERRSYVVRYEDGYEAPVVLFRWRFKGLFRENLELEHFPFDVQDLGVQVSSERSVEEIKLVHDPWNMSSVNTNTFQDSQEWSIYKHVECIPSTTSLEYASSTIHPILYFNCRVKRKVGYFVWNIIFTVILILALSFTTVSIEPAASDRLVSTITLFLTMVAFKLVIKQSLPTISYLTYLDMYVVGSLMFLVMMSVENAVVASLAPDMDKELLTVYDELAIVSLAVFLILSHLIFIIYIQITALKRRRQMLELDKNYQMQARHLLLMQEEKGRHSKPKRKRSM